MDADGVSRDSRQAASSPDAARPQVGPIWLVTSFAGDVSHTGGVASHLETLRRGLEAQGWRVRVLTRRSFGPFAFWLLSGLILLNRLASPLGSYLRARAANVLMRRMLTRAWRDEVPAAVVFEDLHGASPWPVPTLVFVHALDAEAEATAPRWRPLVPARLTRGLLRSYQAWELGQLSRMPAWATVSEGFFSHLTSSYPDAAREDRGRVIHPSVDVPPSAASAGPHAAGATASPAIAETGPASGEGDAAEAPFYLASMGLMVPVKNQRFLLDLLARLPQRCRLLLLGDGPEQPALVRRAAELGVADRVEFLGFLTGEAKYRHLRRAHCFLLPSHQETFSVSLLEARLCGLPVITSRVDVPASFYDLQLDLDVETWREAVEAWLPDSADLQALSQAARRKVEGKYTPDAMAAQILSALRLR
ncbi:MAG: glycosyltransferase family 4 protein [Bacillota bacterium]